MKKFATLLLIIILSVLVAGIYGLLHDQLTYTISPEYYTKFKFYQFGLIDIGTEAQFPNPRIQVSAVGFLATWWVGLVFGIILGLVGLIHKDHKSMLLITMKAFLICLVIAFAIGIIGLWFGQLYLVKTGVDWNLPQDLVDPDSFIAVGSMHNFSYIGGLVGLISSIVYSIRASRKSLTSKNKKGRYISVSTLE